MKIKESELYDPIKYYLEHQGYSVHGEVRNCDITATKDDELIIIELKTTFSIALVMQAIERQEITDSVYVALPVFGNKVYHRQFKGISKLLKRLELGLLFVRFLKTKTNIEIVFHPKIYQRRKNLKKRRDIIREKNARFGDFNKGGSPAKAEKITAYKQNAIQIAVLLNQLEKASPAQLRKIGTCNNTQSILSNNYYGWFEKVKRGVYKLHPHGKECLHNYPKLIELFSIL